MALTITLTTILVIEKPIMPWGWVLLAIFGTGIFVMALKESNGNNRGY
jgi:hypothetical protein